MSDALIHLRVSAELKARWVQESRKEGKRLTDWIVQKIEGKGNEMIRVDLTKSGEAKFEDFFERCAKDDVRKQGVFLEMMDILEDRAGMGESFSYELGRFFTRSGNPEVISFEDDDLIVTGKFSDIDEAINHIATVADLSFEGAEWVYDNTDCPRWDDPKFINYDFLADPKITDIPDEYVN